MASLVFDVAVVDGICRENRNGLATNQTASNRAGNLFCPVNVGIRKLLAGNVAPRLVSALDGKVLGDDRLAEFLVEGSSVGVSIIPTVNCCLWSISCPKVTSHRASCLLS